MPTVGGLLSGILVFTLAPEAEGHGTDSVIAAYHYHQGQIRPRVPLVKIIASALTLGTGGSGGREGPIAQIGAGFGSAAGQPLAAAARRAARARWPPAWARASAPSSARRWPARSSPPKSSTARPEFEPEVIIPTGIASVISYCIFGVYSGWEPLFKIPDLKFTNPWQLGPYLVLALFMAFLAMLYTRTFYGCKRLFDRLRCRRHFRPAVGALADRAGGRRLVWPGELVRAAPAKPGAGGGPQQVLAVLAFGYSAIQDALTQDTNVAASLLLMIALGKIVTTGLTIGSGGSGGVFGPSMVIGGCGGGALGIMFHHLWPAPRPASGEFRDRGHGGLLRRRGQDPLFHADHRQRADGRIQPAAALAVGLHACLSFFPTNNRSMRRRSKAARARRPIKAAYVRQVLAEVRVSKFLSPQQTVATLHAHDPLATVIDRLSDASVPGLARGRWRRPAAGRGQPGGSPPCLAGAGACSPWSWPPTSCGATSGR